MHVPALKERGLADSRDTSTCIGEGRAKEPFWLIITPDPTVETERYGLVLFFASSLGPAHS